MSGYGQDVYGTDPYGLEASLLFFGVDSAVSLGPTTVRVVFNSTVNFLIAPVLNPANYVIGPTLAVHAVIAESPTSVLLTTDPQSAVTYTVTVGDAVNIPDGIHLDPGHNQALFSGFDDISYTAVAISSTRVRLIFNQPMLHEPALTDPSNFAIVTIPGSSLTVSEVILEQSVNTVSLALTLSTPLRSTNYYQITVSNLHAQEGSPVNHPVATFLWVAEPTTVSIPVSDFSGEVQNGLYGIHNGLVFFSPALVTSAANSIIQIDEIDVCTKAYDQYHFPQPIDPIPLYTFGGGVVPTPYPTFLNSAVLWAPFPRLFEARFELGMDKLQDRVPAPVDGSVSATFQQQFDPSRVSLLNDTAWRLFNNTGLSVPPTFITAANLTPIPPGPTTILILNSPLGGNSKMSSSGNVRYAAGAPLQGDSSFVSYPEPIVPAAGSPTADSDMTASVKVTYAPASAITGNSFVSATLTLLP